MSFQNSIDFTNLSWPMGRLIAVCANLFYYNRLGCHSPAPLQFDVLIPSFPCSGNLFRINGRLRMACLVKNFHICSQYSEGRLEKEIGQFRLHVRDTTFQWVITALNYRRREQLRCRSKLTCSRTELPNISQSRQK